MNGCDMYGLLTRFRRWLRERRVMSKCGCVCYCPHCRDILNDSARILDTDPLVVYVCGSCGRQSTWSFDEPVPIWIL